LTGTPPATGQAGIGTAIQVTGTAAIESAAISDFATGINVAKDASALVTKGTFTNVVTPIAYEIPAFAGMTGEGIISADWLGKHVNDADANKIDRIAGKLDLTCPSEIPACAGMTSCGGSVEMYWKETDDNVTLKLFYPLQYHTTCPVAELKDDTLELTAADGTKKEIAIGACYFDCDGLTDVLKDNYVSFAYATAAGSTAEFMPLPAVKISELGDVINTPMIPILAPTTSGMDGADSTTTVYVPGIESGAGSDNQVDASSVDSNESDDSNTDYANFDPNAPLKEKEEVEIEDLKNDDDLKTQQGGTLSQGATGVAAVTGGCSLIR
ncbi:MAG: hypothetical protein HYU98_01360, partial [Deltaproteobacteria bacterium]|nr:hypothetical protein [Deltaproteobacteria bacterium]